MRRGLGTKAEVPSAGNPERGRQHIMKNPRVNRLLAMGCLVVISSGLPEGCATQSPVKQETRSWMPSSVVVKTVRQIPFGSFELSSVARDGRPPKINVRLAKPGEVSKVWPANLAEGALTGAAIAGVGIGALLLSPMGQGAALGGVIALPMFTVMGHLNSSQRAALIRSLEQSDFSEWLTTQLQSRVSKRFPGEPSNEVEIEVLLLGYGFFSDSFSGEFCFWCDAQVRVVDAGAEVFVENIVWHAMERSEGLPPPRLAPLGEFAKDDGKLARETLIEAAQVLAALIDRHLRGSK